MRKLIISAVITFAIIISGNTQALFAGEVQSSKEHGLSQWTWEGKTQGLAKKVKGKYGLSQWTWEGREANQPSQVRGKYGLSQWTWEGKEKTTDQLQKAADGDLYVDLKKNPSKM